MIVNRHAQNFFSALASKTRLLIVEILARQPMNIKSIAHELGISSSMVAKHIKIMEEAEIVKCLNTPGERGIQKICALVHEGLALNFYQTRSFPKRDVVEIPIGEYFGWAAKPSCGIVTDKEVLEFQDDIRCFTNSKRNRAGCIWLTHGYLEYMIPNFAFEKRTLKELRIQLEISSEAPGWEMVWPSDIYIHINGVNIGVFTCSGDYGDIPGIHSPQWYSTNRNVSQYGELKQIIIDQKESRLNGETLSDVAIDSLNLDDSPLISLRIESPESAENPRGFNIFGRGFGNYDHGILMTMIARDDEDA